MTLKTPWEFCNQFIWIPSMKNPLNHLESIYLLLSAIAYSSAAIYLAGLIGRSQETTSYFSGSITKGLSPNVYMAGIAIAVVACLFALGMAWLQFKGKRIGKLAFWLLALGNLIGFAVIRGGMAKMEGKYASKSTYIAAIDTVGVPLLVITLIVMLIVTVRPAPTTQVSSPAQ
jgi:hypothetical protein